MFYLSCVFRMYWDNIREVSFKCEFDVLFSCMFLNFTPTLNIHEVSGNLNLNYDAYILTKQSIQGISYLIMRIK